MNSRKKWNRKYNERITIKQGEPEANVNLKELVSSLKGGRALDLACGLGGNSLFLAKSNYEVQALDVSDVAIDFLRDQAELKQLPIQPTVYDLTDISNLPIEKNSFDLVIVTYYLDRALFPIVKSVIRDQGFFFMETYYQSPTTKNQGVSNQYKLEPEELVNEFGNWNVLFYEENEEEGIQTIFCQKPY